MRMAAALAIGAICTSALPAFSQDVNIPDDMQEELRQTLMTVALADGCNKRFDDPDIYADATAVLADFLRRADVDDSEIVAQQMTDQLSMQPIDRVNPAIEFLINENSCGKIRSALKDRLKDGE